MFFLLLGGAVQYSVQQNLFMRHNVARPLDYVLWGTARSSCVGHGWLHFFLAVRPCHSLCGTARLQPSLCSCLRCIYIVSICYHISCYFSCLQVGRAFASKVAHLRDPELRRLAKGLPLRAAKAKAPSTTERYWRPFQKFREWSSCFEEVVCLPSDEMSVALYLEFLLQQSFPYSTLEPACYGINWAHDLHGFPSPSDSKLVKIMLEAAKGELVKTCSRKNLLLRKWF